MQAASAEAPFSSPEYIFEVKWDGLRCMLFRDPEGKVHIQDRGLNDLTADLPEVSAAATRVPPGSVIDGELVATDSDGRPDYTRLRERLAGGAARKDEIPVAYLAFDALYLEEKPLLRQPLTRRRVRLSKAVEAGGRRSGRAPDGTLRCPLFNGPRPEVHPAEAVRHRPRVVISGHVKPGSLAYDLTRFPF